ncbi:carbohydrate ABC transporter substrate-binding protein (CUT1 family) [Melghirimyces profundicolus]|uniref:Carbohydrate ABC transporter substrate-binding protein (CUT1 family) n=1 Tax=Melghirimyces profundicolus TaxID=1242148 RepID=A0A2T6AZC3_9BACL|nr:ABC transporter substrate-binding protein [Melghirimyces profundicolus]PTX49148.1 carbohydrate ABC transporter substrate-binding protein (CUT1 family) [Melghirimyces profundicolus]
MKMWKKMAAVGLSATLIFSLAACGQGSDQEGSDAEGEKVTITYARGKDQTGATEKIIEAFEKKHPNIDVKFKEMPADTGTSHDQYVTMFSGGSSEIDVFDLDVIWPAEFAQAGYLEPLDRYIQKDGINMDEYVEGAVEAGSYNGQQWAMPKFMDAGLLYYRTDIVKEPPKTWDELVKQAKENKGEKGTKYGYVFQGKQYEGLVCNFIEFIGAYGGKVLDEQGNVVINSKDTVQGLEKMAEIAQSDYVPGNVTAITEVETDAIYKEGQAVFDRQWPYHYALMNKDDSDVKGKVDVAPLPKGDEKSAAALGGWVSGINKNSKHKKEAWEFIKFMNGPEGQKISAIDGGLAPTYLPLFEDEEVKNASPLFENEDYIEGLKAAVSRPVSPEYPKISDIIQVEVSKTLAGKQKPEEAVKVMEKKLKEVVN